MISSNFEIRIANTFTRNYLIQIESSALNFLQVPLATEFLYVPTIFILYQWANLVYCINWYLVRANILEQLSPGRVPVIMYNRELYGDKLDSASASAVSSSFGLSGLSGRHYPDTRTTDYCAAKASSADQKRSLNLYNLLKKVRLDPHFVKPIINTSAPCIWLAF